MTPEDRLDRLDRLERIARLMVRAGVGARGRMREQDQKIEIIIDAQIKNEERFAKMAEAQTELAKAQTDLAQSQMHTDRRLDALIDIIREGRNGKSNS